ncbi:MAG: cryptochrome/photolyase family protein [Halothiobacillaceae bacterium]
MESSMTVLLWFRRDLRLSDNPALSAALRCGRVIPVYVHAPEEEGAGAPGAASRWWLDRALTALDADLQALGSRLVIRRGPTLEALIRLVRETGAEAVFWNRLYEPALIERDRGIKASLKDAGLKVESFNAALLHEPWQILNRSGAAYRVFTPYWKACLAAGLDQAVEPAPASLDPVPEAVTGEPVASLDLAPRIAWDEGLRVTWRPGSGGAWARLDGFLKDVDGYADGRDRMDRDATSRLSPHLHFGEIGPREVVRALLSSAGNPDRPGPEAFLRELGWREFTHYLLYHFPETVDAPLDRRFEAMPWRDAAEDLDAWQRGQTGIPVVDAAMRQLWHTGWMHNRARMIVASFLTKNLLIDWRLGAAWFHDTLVDADLASNVAGWQWVAGSGADAAPYFRVFNPLRQSEKFDPRGEYIRRWVPERSGMQAPAAFDPAVGALGYPRARVDLKASRQRALDAFARIRSPAP